MVVTSTKQHSQFKRPFLPVHVTNVSICPNCQKDVMIFAGPTLLIFCVVDLSRCCWSIESKVEHTNFAKTRYINHNHYLFHPKFYDKVINTYQTAITSRDTQKSKIRTNERQKDAYIVCQEYDPVRGQRQAYGDFTSSMIVGVSSLFTRKFETLSTICSYGSGR